VLYLLPDPRDLSEKLQMEYPFFFHFELAESEARSARRLDPIFNRHVFASKYASSAVIMARLYNGDVQANRNT